MPAFNPLDHPIAFTRPLRIDSTSAWLEHVPFGMLLIDLARPRTLVELGTHTGISFLAFCQAVQQLALDTRCYAVDTWEGDPHSGFYGPEVLSELRLHHDPLYGGFSTLLQSTFDAAVSHFADNSIDLLHIDGLHTYEAVKHDYETWSPKLSDRAVVLFHDTNVRERDFGVWQLWDELQRQHPHFEFVHGHGLGVLRVGRKPVAGLEPLFTMSEEESQRFRGFFFAMGSGLSADVTKQTRLAELGSHADELAAQVADREKAVQALTEHGDALAAQVADREQVVEELRTHASKLEDQVQEHETVTHKLQTDTHAQIESLESALQERSQVVEDLNSRVGELGYEVSRWQNEVQAFQKDREERIKIAATLDQQVESSQIQLDYLQSGFAYRLLVRYWAAVERSLPAGSIRRILYDRLTKALRQLLFWRASRQIAPTEQDRPPRYIQETTQRFTSKTQPVRLIAHYRSPRSFMFADIGEGGAPVAAWDALAKVAPQFAGHHQPRLPGELGAYDPMSPSIWRRQVELARQYGIHGFCFEFHWPSRSALDDEYFRRLASGPPRGFPFCLSWHSEIGIAGPGGLQEDLSAADDRLDESAAAFMQYVGSALRRKNYLRIDHKPVLLVDNVQFLSEIAHLGRLWRDKAHQMSLGDLYLVATQALGPLQPEEIGFDAVVEAPPGGIELDDFSAAQTILNPFYFGRVYRYTDIFNRLQESSQASTYARIGSVLTDWDDHPRMPGQGSSLVFSSPSTYRYWLGESARQARDGNGLVFLSSWNDWVDCAYLEPDHRRGFAYLQATADALRDLTSSSATGESAAPGKLAPEQLVKHHETAVIMHLYYPDMWPEMRSFLRNLGGDFDLYVSIPRNVAFSEDQILVEFPGAAIVRCENRGRDIAPFLNIFSSIYSLGYKYVCKIHTKKSPHREDGENWRQDMLEKTLGSAAIVAAARRILDEQSDVGVVAARGHVLPGATNWDPNARLVRQLSDETGVPWNGPEFLFVGGSMFWFRPAALYPLTLMRIAQADFDPEQGQLDGTLAHAIERFVGIVVERSGYRILELDEEIASGVLAAPDSVPAAAPDWPDLHLDPIIVYQMGKVGSTTVAESLSHSYHVLGLHVPVHHIHVLDNLEWIEDRMKEDRSNPEDSLTGLAQSRALREQMQQDPEKVWRVVSLIRDPVARNVGTFFHNLAELMPDWGERYARGELDADRLHEFFLETKLIHRVPGIWYDEQLKTVFGIDVFASPFPHEAGYEIYNVHWAGENPISRSTPVIRRIRRTPLLLIRLEDLNRCARDAMREFFGLPDFLFVNANMGEEKAYAGLYRAFKSRPLPTEYTESIYGTRFARHFYTAQEIEDFTQRWTQARENQTVPVA